MAEQALRQAHRGSVFSWITAAVFAATLSVYFLPILDAASLKTFASEFAQLPLRLLLIVALVAIRPRPPAERCFWAYLLAAFATWFVTDLVFQLAEGTAVWWAMVQDLGFLAFYPLVVFALEERPDRYRLPLRASMARGWVAYTGVATMLFIYAYFGWLTAWAAPQAFLSAVPSYAFFLVGDLFVLGLLIERVITAGPGWRLTYGLMAAAMAVWAGSDTMDMLDRAGVYTFEYGTYLDFLTYTPYVLFIAACRIRGRQSDPEPLIFEPPRKATVVAAFAYAVVIPLVHVGIYVSGWLPELARKRDALVFVSTGILFLLAFHALRLQRRESQEMRVVVLDADLERNQKMEALGQLAGGIAHDFNNVLLMLQGHVELMGPQLARVPGGGKFVERVRATVEQGSSLTRQLLAFGSRQVVRPEPGSTRKALSDAEELLRRTLGEHIDLQIHADEDVWNVEIERGQLAQVLINLALNARSAMPDGGVLEVHARNVKLRTGDGEGEPLDYVQIEVTDSGRGMDETVRARVFEPFFTTRRETGGTGLGLSVVYGIVKQCDGYITCESKEGRGTTFCIHLPRSTGELVVSEEPLDSLPPLPSRYETVLVAEDQQEIRGLIADYLRGEGYQVLEAADGLEALELERSYGDRIDVLVTDVVMPHVGGVELADRLKHSRPETEVVFVSGYARDLASRPADTATLNFLQKPFRMKELGYEVRRVLDRRPSTH